MEVEVRKLIQVKENHEMLLVYYVEIYFKFDYVKCLV